MKSLVFVMFVSLAGSTAFAMTMEYDSVFVNVESVVGTGSSQTMFVIDWAAGLTPSHAWLYQYDGTKTVANVLDAIAAASADFEWSQSAYVEYINYDDGTELNQTLNIGWLSFWNKNSGTWQWDNLGVYDQPLVNGSWAGIVADDYPDWGDIAPAIPQIPEPITLMLLATGVCAVRRK